MLILQKVHNIWSKLTVRGVSAKQSVEIVHRALVKSENCHRTASPPDLAHCGGGGLLHHGHVLYTYLCHDIDIVIDVGILIDTGVIRTIFDMTS